MKFVNLKFVVFILASFFLFPVLAYGNIIYSTTDYSTSTIGVITQDTASVQNSFADGDIRLIPFNQSDSGINEKLVVALRNSGTIEIYDRQKLSSPSLVSNSIGAHNIHSGVYYKSSLFLLDMGSYRNDSALYKIDPNNGNFSQRIKLSGDDPVYKFYGQKIFESGGAFIVLMQRYQTLGNFPWVEHMEGELLKIDPETLQIMKRWELNRNPMDMAMLNGEVYTISIGGAQGVAGNTPKLEVINIATESRREIDLWSGDRIPAEMNEPQVITIDPESGGMYIAVSSVMDVDTYQTKSSVYRFNPSDNTVSSLFSFPNGSITCMDYDTSNDTIITLFSDYSTYSGSIKIYNKNGTIYREYLPVSLGGSAYQSVLSSNVGVEDVKVAPEGGCSSNAFPFWILLPALFMKFLVLRKNQYRIIIIACALFTLTAPAFAGVVQLSEETVSGSRIQEDSDYSPGSVTVISVKQIEGEVNDLPTLLERVPGLQVTQLRGRGQYTVASIRGSTSSQVAVYIDGQLANTGGDAAFDLSAIPFRNVERIEVYKGYIPARFGVAGIGGVINIVTRGVKDKPEFSLFADIGSFGKKSAALSWTGRLFDGNYFLGAGYEGYAGNFSYENDNATPDNFDDDYYARRRNNGFDRYNLLFKWEKDGLAFRGEWQKRYQELPRSAPGNDKQTETSGASLTTEQLNLQLGKRFQIGEVDMGISVAWLNQNKEFEDPNMTIGNTKWDEYSTRRLNVGYDASFKAGERNLIEFIANYSDEKLDGKLNNMKASSYQTSLVLQDTINIDDAGTMLLSPLIRWNKAEDDDALTWNVALSKQFGENLFLRASYGNYVRIPNLYEKYGDGSILRASPLLKWEYG
ncbi:MAG: TonB-dependent receptor plug domain-containing protein, partial [Synergistaceae bacterium]|nr:TonB-dependent receptor plug domain-containing protein [Synergistaceae bacterium]